VVAAVVQHDEQPGQRLHHVPLVEEDLRHDEHAVTTHPDEVALTQVLMDLGHGNAKHGGYGGQVVDGLIGV